MPNRFFSPASQHFRHWREPLTISPPQSGQGARSRTFAPGAGTAVPYRTTARNITTAEKAGISELVIFRNEVLRHPCRSDNTSVAWVILELWKGREFVKFVEVTDTCRLVSARLQMHHIALLRQVFRLLYSLAVHPVKEKIILALFFFLVL
jgi:hypothetical protein